MLAENRRNQLQSASRPTGSHCHSLAGLASYILISARQQQGGFQAPAEDRRKQLQFVCQPGGPQQHSP
eukprot:15440919-Alexandrium_andersonii.AAC.1